MLSAHSRSPLTLFVLGSIVATLTSIGGWILSPIESVYLASLTDNEFLIGFTFALGSLLVAMLGLYLGRLSDRLGRKRILIVGLMLGIVFPLVYAGAINILMYMGGKFAWSVAIVATGPILGAYLQSLVQGMPKRGHYLSLLYGSMSLSGALGHYLGGFLTDLIGARAPFYVLSGIYLISTLAAWVLLYEDPQSKKHLNEEDGLDAKDLFFGIRYIFTRVPLRYYFILNSAFAVLYAIKLLLWPLIVFSFTPSAQTMGIIFAMTGVAAFLIFTFSGRVIDHLGPYAGMHIAFSSLIVGGIGMGLAPSVWWFALGAFVFTIGEAFYGSSQGVLLIDYVENQHRGEILGVDHIFDRGLSALAMLGSGALLLVMGPQVVWLWFVLGLIVLYLLGSWYRVAKSSQFVSVIEEQTAV